MYIYSLCVCIFDKRECRHNTFCGLYIDIAPLSS